MRLYWSGWLGCLHRMTVTAVRNAYRGSDTQRAEVRKKGRTARCGGPCNKFRLDHMGEASEGDAASLILVMVDSASETPVTETMSDGTMAPKTSAITFSSVVTVLEAGNWAA